MGGAAFQSLTDALDPAPIIVPKQHFVEWFSGDAIDTIWTVTTLAGSNTEQMSDGVNQGYEIITGTSSANRSSIAFNNIRHYEETGCVFIHVSQVTSTASIGSQTGLSATAPEIGDDTIAVGYDTALLGTNYMLKTERVSSTITDTGVAADTNFHKFKGQMRASSALASVDDVLSAVSTANLSINPMQPIHEVITRTAASKTARIRYYEAYNT